MPWARSANKVDASEDGNTNRAGLGGSSSRFSSHGVYQYAFGCKLTCHDT